MLCPIYLWLVFRYGVIFAVSVMGLILVFPSCLLMVYKNSAEPWKFISYCKTQVLSVLKWMFPKTDRWCPPLSFFLGRSRSKEKTDSGESSKEKKKDKDDKEDEKEKDAGVCLLT